MFVVADIGGTNGRVVAYATKDPATLLGETHFSVFNVFNADREELEYACIRLQRDHGPIEGIALAVAGEVAPDRLRLRVAGNLTTWVGENIVTPLSELFACPVVLGNDAEAAAIADAVYGLGVLPEYKGVEFMGVIWGTGVGGSCVRYVNGRLVSFSTECGHQCASPGSMVKCGCGQFGCLETQCGGAYLERHFRCAAEELSEDDWRRLADQMVVGLRNILAVHRVPLVVFSGGVICKQAWLLPYMQERLQHPMIGAPTLQLSHFGESAGIIGALSLFALLD